MTKTPRIQPNARTVEIVAFPAVQLLDVAGPLQAFSTANDIHARRLGGAPYSISVVSAAAPRVVTSARLELSVSALPTGETSPDTLIVAGGPGVDAAAADRDLIEWLAARSNAARRTASVCTGAFLLAATGRLDGRRAVTHWSFCDELGRRHPEIEVNPHPIFVRDGDVWTSAGVSAGIDLALALIEEDLGRELALAVARHLVMFVKRPGGQSQFSETLAMQSRDGRFDALHQWMAEHLEEDLSLEALAERAGMSSRNFSRRYLEATGVTPARAVERLRVEAARRRLVESDAPVKRIALRCGFGSEETLRRSFQRLVATTPQDYRERFRSRP